MIDDFAQQNGLVGAGLVDPDGRALLLSTGTPPLRYNPIDLLDDRTERGVSPVRAGNRDDAAILGARLLMDVALPVPSARPWFAGADADTAAVLFMIVPVADQLANLLDPGPALAFGERFRLIQWGEQGSEQVIPGPDPRLVPFSIGEPLGPGEPRPYGPLVRADGTETFTVGAAVPGVPWTVLHEIERTAALAPLREFADDGARSGRSGGARPGACLRRLLVAAHRHPPEGAGPAVSRARRRDCIASAVCSRASPTPCRRCSA